MNSVHEESLRLAKLWLENVDSAEFIEEYESLRIPQTIKKTGKVTMKNKILAALWALTMIPWFIKESWNFVVTPSLSSKFSYFYGIALATFRFYISMYNECLRHITLINDSPGN